MWGYELLSVTRISGVIQTLANVLEAPANMIYLNSTPEVNATDGEILGTYEGHVVSADIINDDQSAVVRAAGRFQLSTSAIPNIKQGSLITQSLLNLLNRINAGGGVRSDGGVIENYLRNEALAKIQAIRIMQNRMIAGMHMDQFDYEKMGVLYRNVSWGMPADLKFVPSIPWTAANAGTMTPIADLRTMRDYAANTYGEEYNRLRLARSLFNNIIGSTEFREDAKLYTAAANTTGTFAAVAVTAKQQLLEQMTGLILEISDATYRDEMNDGSIPTKRYVPEHVAILGNTADDNNSTAMDWANAIVNESEVGTVPGTQVVGGGFPAPAYGPVGYATIRGDLNPPNLTIWAVMRGFPRKKRATATARIDAYTPTV